MAAAEHLKSGSRLGPYELLAPLGAGGMGEVWKARDTRLDRVVAVKFSHAGLSDRFQREARAIAALNHPNIATLHDVGDNYLVMEYVYGEPLRPPGDTRRLLDIAVQIADGLAAAHSAGFVHRDLKPDNILLTRQGRVKILDFGLAKQTGAPAQDEATMTVVTNPGTVMGTVAYMSPEQARGEDLDARSDQFSFGQILYELATGKRAFQRSTAAETMAAIIRDEPEPLPAAIPAPFRWTIGRLLAKDPACRYDTTRGLYLELQTLRERLSETAPVAATAAPGRGQWRPRLALPVVASFLLAAAIILALWSREPWRPDVSSYRFAPFATEVDGEYGAVWSPDGRSLAYVARTPTEMHIMVRNADGSAPAILAKIPLPISVIGTLVESLSWSADGTRVYFLQGRQPWSVARAGGVPEPLPAPAKSVTHSIALSPDGTSLALLRDADREGKRTRRVWISSPTAASPAPLPHALQCCEVTYGNLSWSPDSSRLLVVESIPGRRRRLLLMERDGHTRTLAEFTGLNEVQHSWLPDNRHAVLALTPEKTGLQVIDTETRQVRAFLPSPERVAFPSVSPDGKRIVYTQGLTRFRLMEIPFDGTPPRPFLSSKVDQSELAWSPAGDEFAYIYGDEIRVRNRAGTFERVAVSPKDFVMAGSRVLERPAFSPDGQRIAYGMAGRGQGITVWISPPGGGAPVPLLQDQRWTLNPIWSPDGAFLYFNMPPGGLHRHRVGSAGEPERISQGCNASSSGASFILCASPAAGLYTVSLDGKNERRISSDPVVSAALTRDERSIYALRRKEQKQDLVRVDVATGRTEVLSVLAEPLDIRGPLGGPTRLAISPDEKSVIVTVRSNEGDIWILDGFEPPKSFWERLWPRKR